MNKTKQLLQAAWRKALAGGKVTIVMRTKKEALQLRFALYDATKKEKEGEGNFDLIEARQQCRVLWDGDCTITIQREDVDGFLERIAGALDIDIGQVSASIDLPPVKGSLAPMPSGDEMAESARRLMKRLADGDKEENAPRGYTGISRAAPEEIKANVSSWLIPPTKGDDK